jgi:hypothetical protein
MKKLFAVLVLMLLVSLFVPALVVGSAQAGQENDVWQKVHASWPDEHGYYKGAPNGVVHEKWSCNSDWQDCDGAALYFPVDGFESRHRTRRAAQISVKGCGTAQMSTLVTTPMSQTSWSSARVIGSVTRSAKNSFGVQNRVARYHP